MFQRYFLAPLAALLLLAAAPRLTHAQTGAVGIGTTAPDASAVLDLTSTSKGLLPPRLSQAQRDAIASPATGLLVFQTDGTPGFYYNAGTAAAPNWQPLTTAAASALTFGSGLTQAGSAVGLGGTLGQNTTLGLAGYSLGLTDGSVGIGTSTPGAGLHVRTAEKASTSNTTGVFLSGGASGNPNIELRGTNGVTYLDFANDLTADYTARILSTSAGLGFYTTLTSPVLLLNSSNVGIGTSSPSQKLEVAGQVFSSTGGFRFPDNTVQTTAATTSNAILNQTTLQSGANFNIGGNGYVGGRVGIGTTALPVEKLEIRDGNLQLTATSGTAQPTSMGISNNSGSLNLALAANNGEYSDLAQSGDAVLRANGHRLILAARDGGNVLMSTGTAGAETERLRITTGGNVGIGADNPSQKLEVAGSIKFTGTGSALTFPDGSVQTTAATLTNAVLNQTTLQNGASFNIGGNGYVGGSMGIGTTAPAASAALDVSSSTRGFLPPRLTKTQRDAIASPAAGLIIYNTTINKINTWNGTSWDASLNAEEQPYQGPTVTLGYTGGVQTYVVPVGVNTITVDARGARGGNGSTGAGGQGGRIKATIPVVPGETLNIYVGGAGFDSGVNTGGGGFNGGGNGYRYVHGGGGGTDVRRGTALTGRLIVAGGGGGATEGGYGGDPTPTGGGAGGYPNGLAGSNAYGTGGGGGTQTGPGSYGSPPASLGQGGEGICAYQSGGGGGYYGGGGGRPPLGQNSCDRSQPAAGGGGSSWVTPNGSTLLLTETGTNNGNGSVSITPGFQYAAPVLSGANFVNVPGDNLGNHTATQNLNLAAYQLVGNGGSTGMTISNAGNVGIGTAAPGHPLTVQADNVTNGRLLGFNDASGSDKYNFSRQAATGSGASAVPGGLNLSESNVAGGRLFVQDGGNVGIGNTSPGQKLDVSGNARVSGSITTGGSLGVGTNAPAGGLHVTTGNGGAGTGASTAGVVMSGTPGQPPYLELRGSGAGTTTSTPYLDFAETNDVDYSTRLRSISGTLTVEGSNALLLKVNGSVQATNVTYTSDARFKQHVRPLAGALASVLALRGVRYEWNALGVKHGGTAGAPQVGFLAQELENVYPELVSTDKDGYKAVNYAQLTPVLLEAIKELKAENDALKARTAAAEANAEAAKAQAAQATATLETFEARLRRLEAGTAQAQR